ncbi:hypothetical protein HG536_0F03370 [Torulaspora globosa]|uniref:Actin cytoskeleton-regulatory complex protein PAN1 n=1 Tax=Torulaspora globosa TaxID=48254 RepID=A0A7G3ZKH6_9SACH|nr:uncharacterized protein HG536_0F03370 [Torulaspora globosa]QLL34012.1 hypothetical protein HG536_0F03370 [Torulaspora globosa]
MFNPYEVQSNSGSQATGYYQQMPPQQRQPQQQQLAPFNQTEQQNVGFSSVQQNLNSFPNQSQSVTQQMSGFNGTNALLNSATMGQAKGNYYEQNASIPAGAAFNPKANPTSNPSAFESSNNFQAQAQPLQTQGTGFYNIPFQQPQIQLGGQPQQQQQQQYGQTGMQPQVQQPYQQAGMQAQPLTQQPTGPLSHPQQLQHQATGPQVLQLQQQRTGPQSQFLQPQSTGYGQMQALLPQQTGFYIQSQQQTPLEPLRPNATGFVNSFANNGINNDVKIPARRLSFITANDQAKFERLFRSRVAKGSNTISGNDCKAILMKSGLQPSQLARIWALCDTSKAGELLFPEFALAMHLVNNVLQGDSIPFELQSKIKNEVSSFIDAINLSIASGSQTDLAQTRTPFDQYLPTNAPSLQPQPTASMPQTSFGFPLQSQLTGGAVLNPQMTGSLPQTTFGMPAQTTGGVQLNQQMTGGRLQPLNTGFMPQTSFNAPIQPHATGNGMLQSQMTGGFAPNGMNQNYNSIVPQTTGGFNNALTSQGNATYNQQINLAGGAVTSQQASIPLQQQRTGGTIPNLTSQSTGSIPIQQPSLTGLAAPNAMPQVGNDIPPQVQLYGGLSSTLPSQSTGNLASLQNQPTGYLPPSGFNPTMPLTAQKTGFGNNEIYSQSNFGSEFTAQNADSITPEEKSLFYKIFETYDTNNRGLLDSSSAVEIFRKSGLNRSDLEHIWNLCDVNNSGQLNKQEFALGMHLVYRKLNGFQLPNRLPLSLIPSSTKIIDNVKNQLKSVPNKENKQKSKIDALSYKNNDDEVLPSFRNRRKVFNNTVTSSQKTTRPESDVKREKMVSLRKAIEEKRTILHSLRTHELTTSEQDELRRVEILKSELKNLPQFPNVENDAVPIELRNRFDDVISKLPRIFSRIAEVDNEITNAKVRLFKLKNPSSLSGTGINGEITEEDRRKAKSKAILKARMDALTGRQTGPTESLEEEERKYNLEIRRIQNESGKNQHIIDDIRNSISEISASLRSNMNGGVYGGNPADFGKWEFGAGLLPEVRSFIETLNSSKETTSRNAVPHSQYPSPGSQSGASVSDARSAEAQKPSTFASISDVEDDEEERRLREELAKLKLKKKTEKEKRLAELRRQVEEAKVDSDDDKSDFVPVAKPVGNSAAPVVNQTLTPSDIHNSTKPVVQHSSKTPEDPVSSVPAGDRNPFFKQKDPSGSSFDLKAAETQRRLQRGLDDDDDGWSDDEPQTIKAKDQTGGQHAYAKKEPNMEIQTIDARNANSLSSPAMAPPLPSLGGTVDSNSGLSGANNEAVPLAPHLPQAGTAGAPPVPIAPPLPQINSGAGFSMPPPPALPGQSIASAGQNQLSVKSHNLDHGQDSDDVLSIPESVSSVDEDGSQPSGIPPPPPLP